MSPCHVSFVLRFIRFLSGLSGAKDGLDMKDFHAMTNSDERNHNWFRFFIKFYLYPSSISWDFSKIIPLSNYIYRKVANSSLSLLVAHFWSFRLFMRGKFDAYKLWPLAQRVWNWIVDWSTARYFTVHEITYVT